MRPVRIKKILLIDFIGVCLVFVGSVVLGLIFNDLRKTPLTCVYASPKERMDSLVATIGDGSGAANAQTLNAEVSIQEIGKISSNASATILDARPEVFYKFAHIPSALSLPRDGFKDHYSNLESKLKSLKNSLIIVYCSGGDCQDSQLVAGALKSLGYTQVRVFRGGWAQWKSFHYPEKSE